MKHLDKLKFFLIYKLLRIKTFMDYKKNIKITPGKRSGKPCIRDTRITVYDILEMLANGMSIENIVGGFPKHTKQDIYSYLAFAADGERNQLIIM